MEKLKFILFSIVVLALVGILGYWAVLSLQSGAEHIAQERIKQLEKENEELKNEVLQLRSQAQEIMLRLEQFQ